MEKHRFGGVFRTKCWGKSINLRRKYTTLEKSTLCGAEQF
jgi:hypothetical protein